MTKSQAWDWYLEPMLSRATFNGNIINGQQAADQDLPSPGIAQVAALYFGVSVDNIPLVVQDVLADKAHGHPQFAKELVRSPVCVCLFVFFVQLFDPRCRLYIMVFLFFVICL